MQGIEKVRVIGFNPESAKHWLVTIFTSLRTATESW